MSEEDKKKLKIDPDEVILFVKIFGESMKEFIETGKTDLDFEGKIVEHSKDVIEHLIKKEKEKDE